jgi:CDGSH iron-sulfur domain-containing protein 3
MQKLPPNRQRLKKVNRLLRRTLNSPAPSTVWHILQAMTDPTESKEPSVTIHVRPSGPLLIEGPVTIVDQHGGVFTPRADKPRIALCRCGHSANKPFCDGAHNHCGFEAEELGRPQSPPA